jgi:hypothetical protein
LPHLEWLDLQDNLITELPLALAKMNSLRIVCAAAAAAACCGSTILQINTHHQSIAAFAW